MILKISLRVKAGVPKTLVKRKLRLHSLYFPQNKLMLTESRGELSDLHSIFRLRALRYCPTENISPRYYFLDNKSLLRFQFIHEKQSQAFFNGRLEVIFEFTPNTVAR